MIKKIILTLSLLLSCSSAFADPVTGIEVLDVIKEKDTVSLKLHSADRGPKDSWFIVIVDKSDPKFDQKMGLIEKKMKQKDLKLGLNIMSFSASPSGSVYRASDIDFFKSE